MARRNKRQGAFSTYLIIFISMALVAFVLYTVLSSVIQRTAIIESGNMGNQYDAEAVVVRAEAVTDVEGLTSVTYYADEGELLIKGSKIAEVYSTGYSQTDINKLLSVRADIKQQVKTALASDMSDAQLTRLDDQVIDYARELSMLVQGKENGNLLNLERQLGSSLSRRQSYLREKFYNSQPNLADLYDNETTLTKKIQSWTATYLADRDCIVSFYTDGYETMLDLETFDEITIALARSVLNGDEPALSTVQRGRTSVFRQVTPNGWYILIISTDKNWNPVNGQSYKVQLEGFDDHIVDAVVSSFTRVGNELLVRMSVAGDVRPVLNVRTARATVGETYVSGLKVPVEALRAQGGYTGVVLTDNGGLFVPVEIIMQDNKYAVIQSLAPGVLWEGQKIRVF